MLCKKNYCYNDNKWRKKDMLNDRQMHVIDLLNDKKWITGKEMAHILNVTDRTIRNAIENINQFYDCLIKHFYQNKILNPRKLFHKHHMKDVFG